MNSRFLTPPDDGSRNAVSVFGRHYQSAPGVPIAVPDFDIPILEANGWTVFNGASIPTTTSVYASGVVSGVLTSPHGASAGFGVRLYIDGSSTPIGATVTDGDGSWSISTGSLVPGPHMFSVEIDESAGSFVVSAAVPDGGMNFSDAQNSALLAAVAA